MAEPPITIRAYHMSGANGAVNRVVIHSTSPGMKGTSSSAAGMARSTARYFTSPSSGGSAHYIVDVSAEEHCVPDDRVAWHAPPNGHSIGIEVCAEPTYTRDVWLSDAVWPAVKRAASRTKELCDRLRVPKVRVSANELKAGKRGVCGHVDVSGAWHQSDHWDPGPNFPWDRFMTLVQGLPEPAPPTPPQPVWDYPEDQVKTTLVLVGPLDNEGNGYGDWVPGSTAPILVGAVKQGPDPSAGSSDAQSGDPYWGKQGNYSVSASVRGAAIRVVITHGVSGQTVGVYVSAA